MPDNTPGESAPAGAPPRGFLVILWGYGVVAVFLVVFGGLVIYGKPLSPVLATPSWAALVAALVMIPILLPWFQKHVFSRLKSLKILDLLEFSLSEAEAKAQSLAALAGELGHDIKGEQSAREYFPLMTSRSASIVSAIRQVQREPVDFFLVNLGKGREWLAPNLYFLALLAAQKTRIRQLAFVETRDRPDMFVCTTSPGELINAMSTWYPVLREAAETASFAQAIDTVDNNSGMAYFDELNRRLPNSQIDRQVKELWLAAGTLLPILGQAAHSDTLDWREALTEADYRKILRCPYPFLGAVEDGQLLHLIDRDRVALRLARAIAGHAI